MRIRKPVIVAALIGIWPSLGNAAIFDVTGYWKADDKSVTIVVERQFNTYKIGIVQKLQNTEPRVSFATSADQKGNGFSSSAYTYQSGTQGLRRQGLTQVTSGTVDVSFTDQSHGTLVWQGKRYAIEREEFATSGLSTPINPNGPETGWYASSGSNFVFVENQGASTKVMAFEAGNAGVKSEIYVTASGNVKPASDLASVTFSQTNKKFLRDDFENPDHKNVDADKTSAYSIPVSAEVEIKKIAAASSMRIRAALRERVAAYQAYFTNQTRDQAVTTTQRDLISYQCIRDLTPVAIDDVKYEIDEIIFDTLKKGEAYLNLQSQLGTVVIGDQDVSASSPNRCAVFMQGLTRYFTQLRTNQNARAKVSTPQMSQERAQLSADLQGQMARRAVIAPKASVDTPTTTLGSNQSCNKDEFIFLSGVGTNAVDAKIQADVMKNYFSADLGLTPNDFTVKSISNPNPNTIFNISQVLLNRFNVSVREVALFQRLGIEFFARSQNYPAAVSSFVVGEIAKAAIRTDKAASANIASVLRADVNDGFRPLLVAHSQGNILTNGGVEQLDAATQAFIGMTSVASADNRVAGRGRLGSLDSATRDDDRIINALRLIKSDTLGATIPNAGDPKDFFRHYFKNSYLDNLVARRSIITRLKVAMNKAKSPSNNIALGSDSGGFTGPTGQQRSFNVGRNVKDIDIEYNMYSIPDAMDVFYRGTRVASTNGAVSFTGTLRAKLPVKADDRMAQTIDVIVYGTDPGTAWLYSVKCPSTTPKTQ